MANAACDQPGSIYVNTTGGSADYTIVLTGSGATVASTTNSTGDYTFAGIGGGTYQVTVTDANGCSHTETITVGSTGSNLTVSTAVSNGTCGQSGSVSVNTTGGSADYTIVVTGSGATVASTTNSSGDYTFTGLGNGTYQVITTDANGCTGTDNFTINNSGTIAFIATANNGDCGSTGAIDVNITSGTPEYYIAWAGTASGNAYTSNNNSIYTINDLSSGQYSITVTDANNCSAVENVSINNTGGLTFTSTEVNAGCSVNGSSTINIVGGSPTYQVYWDGPTTGVINSNTTTVDIPNLGAGIYTIKIYDGNDCLAEGGFTIADDCCELDITSTPIHASCDTPGSFWFNVNNGTGPYNYEWSGTSSGTISDVPTTNFDIQNLDVGTYTVTITDANNCSIIVTETIIQADSAPVADFTWEQTGSLTVTFTNTSADGTYLWDFGDGNTSTQTNPNYTFCDEGIQTVCLTVTNNCGTTTTCHDVNVQIPGDVVILRVADTGGSSGNTIYVPVTIENCGLLVSLAGSLQVIDPTVANIIGVSAGAINPQYFPNGNTFNYYDNNGQGVYVDDGEILFYIVVELTGDPGDSTFVTIDNDPLPIEVGGLVDGVATELPYVVLKGEVECYNTGQVQGQILTFWDQGVNEASVYANGSTYNTMEMTDLNGYYNMPDVLFGEEYMITPEKDTLDENGLSTFALFIGQRFILGMEPVEIYSPYQIIAGDANCNGAFTTLDLFIIQQLIIGTATEFADCASWVFVSSAYDMPEDFNSYNVFPYTNCDTMTINSDTLSNFVGIKVGDILGHANPENFTGEIVEDRSLNDLVLNVPNRSVEAGESFELNFTGKNFEDIVSYQMELNFDTDQLEYRSFIPSERAGLSTAIAGSRNADDGSVRISWFSGNGQAQSSNDNNIFTLRFTAKEDIKDLTELLSIVSENILSEAYDNGSEPMNITLEFTEATIAQVETGYHLYQNTPNPFEDNTTIGFDLPSDMDAEIIISDYLGRQVKTYNGTYLKGYNTIHVKDLVSGSGIFYYTLKTQDFTATRSMIILE